MGMTVADALSDALETAATSGADGATIELAKRYAAEIDAGEDLAKLGPKLLACLDALLMTPKARAAVVKGGEDEPETNPLDDLRERRRKRYTTAVDAATT